MSGVWVSIPDRKPPAPRVTKEDKQMAKVEKQQEHVSMLLGLRTPEREKKILRLLRAGNQLNTAAMASGVLPSTVEEWARADPAFAEKLMVAQAQAEIKCLELVMGHAEKKWEAAAYVLERRYPSNWKQRTTLEIDIGRLSNDDLMQLARRIAGQLPVGLMGGNSAPVALPEPSDPGDTIDAEFEDDLA